MADKNQSHHEEEHRRTGQKKQLGLQARAHANVVVLQRALSAPEPAQTPTSFSFRCLYKLLECVVRWQLSKRKLDLPTLNRRLTVPRSPMQPYNFHSCICVYIRTHLDARHSFKNIGFKNSSALSVKSGGDRRFATSASERTSETSTSLGRYWEAARSARRVCRGPKQAQKKSGTMGDFGGCILLGGSLEGPLCPRSPRGLQAFESEESFPSLLVGSGLSVLLILLVESRSRYLRSSKLTWKWRGASEKTTILYIGPFMSFHVIWERVSILFEM